MKTSDSADLDEAALAKAAYNLFGCGYIKHYPDDLEKFKTLIDSFLTNVSAGGRILDVGCGNGDYVAYFQKLGFDAFGSDISEVMLAEAAKKVAPERLCIADMHDMTVFTDSSFDAVTSICSMLYTSKKRLSDVLKNVERILKPDGMFLLMMLEGNSEGIEKEAYFGKEGTAYSAYYSAAELEQILLSCGLKTRIIRHTRRVVLTKREITLFSQKSPDKNLQK